MDDASSKRPSSEPRRREEATKDKGEKIPKVKKASAKQGLVPRSISVTAASEAAKDEHGIGPLPSGDSAEIQRQASQPFPGSPQERTERTESPSASGKPRRSKAPRPKSLDRPEERGQGQGLPGSSSTEATLSHAVFEESASQVASPQAVERAPVSARRKASSYRPSNTDAAAAGEDEAAAEPAPALRSASRGKLRESSGAREQRQAGREGETQFEAEEDASMRSSSSGRQRRVRSQQQRSARTVSGEILNTGNPLSPLHAAVELGEGSVRKSSSAGKQRKERQRIAQGEQRLEGEGEGVEEREGASVRMRRGSAGGGTIKEGAEDGEDSAKRRGLKASRPQASSSAPRDWPSESADSGVATARTGSQGSPTFPKSDDQTGLPFDSTHAAAGPQSPSLGSREGYTDPRGGAVLGRKGLPPSRLGTGASTSRRASADSTVMSNLTSTVSIGDTTTLDTGFRSLGAGGDTRTSDTSARLAAVKAGSVRLSPDANPFNRSSSDGGVVGNDKSHSLNETAAGAQTSFEARGGASAGSSPSLFPPGIPAAALGMPRSLSRGALEGPDLWEAYQQQDEEVLGDEAAGTGTGAGAIAGTVAGAVAGAGTGAVAGAGIRGGTGAVLGAGLGAEAGGESDSSSGGEVWEEEEEEGHGWEPSFRGSGSGTGAGLGLGPGPGAGHAGGHAEGHTGGHNGGHTEGHRAQHMFPASGPTSSAVGGPLGFHGLSSRDGLEPAETPRLPVAGGRAAARDWGGDRGVAGRVGGEGAEGERERGVSPERGLGREGRGKGEGETRGTEEVGEGGEEGEGGRGGEEGEGEAGGEEEEGAPLVEKTLSTKEREKDAAWQEALARVGRLEAESKMATEEIVRKIVREERAASPKKGVILSHLNPTLNAHLNPTLNAHLNPTLNSHLYQSPTPRESRRGKSGARTGTRPSQSGPVTSKVGTHLPYPTSHSHKSALGRAGLGPGQGHVQGLGMGLGPGQGGGQGAGPGRAGSEAMQQRLTELTKEVRETPLGCLSFFSFCPLAARCVADPCFTYLLVSGSCLNPKP